MICTETGQPIYMVANQASLQEICTYLPLTKKDLMHDQLVLEKQRQKNMVMKYWKLLRVFVKGMVWKPIWLQKKAILKKKESQNQLNQKQIPKLFLLIYIKKEKILLLLQKKEILQPVPLRAIWLILLVPAKLISTTW